MESRRHEKNLSMHNILRLGAFLGLMTAAVSGAEAAVVSLPDGTGTATQIESEWHGFTTTTAAGIDAQNASSVIITATITDISDPKYLWMEVGLMPRSVRDAAGGQDGGLGVYATNWWDAHKDYGVSLLFDAQDGPFVYPLDAPTIADPWTFTITMTPSGTDGGTATLEMLGHALDENSLTLGGYTGDYSDAVLFLQFGTTESGATVSYSNVSATVVPEPASALLLGIVGLMVTVRRRRAAA